MNLDKTIMNAGNTRKHRRSTLEMFRCTVRDDGLLEYPDGTIAECPHEEEKITVDDYAVVPRDNEHGFVLIKPTEYAFAFELALEDA